MHSGASKHAPIPTYVIMRALKEIRTHTHTHALDTIYYTCTTAIHYSHRSLRRVSSPQDPSTASDLSSQRDNALGRCDARVIHRPRLSAPVCPVNRKPFYWGNNL